MVVPRDQISLNSSGRINKHLSFKTPHQKILFKNRRENENIIFHSLYWCKCSAHCQYSIQWRTSIGFEPVLGKFHSNLGIPKIRSMGHDKKMSVIVIPGL